MPAVFDLRCIECGETFPDVLFVRGLPDHIRHVGCGGEVGLTLLSRRSRAPWSDKDAVVVFRNADGSYRYPGRNDVVTPPGYERIVMRSLREIEAFERKANVRSEMAWYDSGSGRGFDDTFRGKPW